MAHAYPRLSLFTLTAGLLAATAFGQPGTKDPTFVTGSGFEAANVWDQEVSALVLQPDGKLLVGGAFNTYNGVARNRIARLEVNGALDTGFDPGSGINSGQPYWGATALALQPDGKVLVGGHFTTFNGTPKGALVRLNADGSLDPGFGTAAGFVGNSYVYALAVCADGKVLVAGQFQDYEGHACHNLIRLTAEGAFDPTFDPGTGPSEVIYTMALRADQRILVGGAFDHFNGVPVGFFAQLNADGSLDSGFNAGTGFNYRVWCIALRPDDTMLVGGEFTAVAGVPRQRIARLHPDGTLDTGFDPGPSTSTEVTALAVEPDGDVLAGGRFTDFGGVARSNIMRLTPDGAVDPLFDPGSGTDAGFPYRGVTALAVRPDGKVLAGGTFTHFNGSPENRIVQLFGDCVPGASCDDSDVLTGPDHFTADCTCTGPAIDCLGVPGGSALPGTACDDGDAATGNDTYNTACQCAGLPYDCLGIAGGAAVPGSPCDDGEPGTGNDTYQTDCVCAGALIDCAGVPGGTALPGSTCNDGSVLTGPDTWDNGCICTGPAIDCLGVPNGTTLPGSPCDDGNAGTSADMFTTGCVCQGTPIAQQVMTIAGGRGANAFTICGDGMVSSWGDGADGQLGNGSFTNSSIPLLISSLSGASAVEGGGDHALALKTDGTVWAWGRNFYGELGIGNNVLHAVPVPVSALSGITAIACGGTHSLALSGDGMVWSWGSNYFLQLGDGTAADSNFPVPVSSLTDVTAIAGGFYHSIALANDSTVWTWGRDFYGELGDGTNNNSNVPVPVNSLTGVTAIAGGFGHSLALRKDSTVWAWGYGLWGQLGNGSNANSNVPVQVSPLTHVIAIAGGGYHSLALKDDGTVWAWGNNYLGQLGNGGNAHSYVPLQVPGLSGVVAIAGGDQFSLALKNDGTLWAWGGNANGELGQGNNVDSNVPVEVIGPCAAELDCQPTQLTTNANPVVSCGAVNLKFDGSSIIAANEVPGANRYQFRFTNSAGQPFYSRNIAFPTRSFTLTKWYTNPLKAGRTYNVVVRASFDNGATWCDYGPSCTVRISWSPLAPGMVRDVEATAPELLVYPNPANGEEVRIRLGGADPALTTATLDLTDLFGKRVMTATLPMQEGELNAMLPLSTDLADGLYLLTITAGEQVLNERVVITR